MDKMDILNRDKFVEQLVRLIENISDNKTSTCFAINGAWGSGKSFVLDMFEEELKPYSEKYFVVRYNCWKYDYYEEPLIAIVSEILKVIDSKTKLIPDTEKNRKRQDTLIATSKAMVPVVNNMIKAQTGIDFKNSLSFISTVLKGKKERENSHLENYSYDKYFQLNKVIDKLSEALQSIAKEYTVIIIVDELDRCIPEYAVKVLERMHHLTENKENIITVIAIDKEQLLESIKHSLGNIDSKKYLEKFINFELLLNNGVVSEKITEKYSGYINLFSKELLGCSVSADEYMHIIFKEIEPRKQEQIMKKVIIAHNLLFPEKKDYSFMCLELLIAVMVCEYNRSGQFSSVVHLNQPSIAFGNYISGPEPAFKNFFIEKFEKVKFIIQPTTSSYRPTIYTLKNDLNFYEVIYTTWYLLHPKDDKIELLINDSELEKQIKENVEELKKFVDTIKLLK